MHFYIIFGTNLLTGGPVQITVFLPILVFRRKGISNGVQMEWNQLFLEWKQSRRLGVHVRESTRRARGRGRAYPQARPPPSWGPHCSPTYFFLLYIPMYPGNIRYGAKTLFPPPQPSVPMRSHLGAFSGASPEGALITEGFYINTIASPMMCE